MKYVSNIKNVLVGLAFMCFALSAIAANSTFAFNGRSCVGNDCTGSWVPYATAPFYFSDLLHFGTDFDQFYTRYILSTKYQGGDLKYSIVQTNANGASITIDAYDKSRSVVATFGGKVYQMHSSGHVFVYNGTPGSWTRIDANSQTVEILTVGKDLFQLHNDGSIFRYTGVGSNWEVVDQGYGIDIESVDGVLYKLSSNGHIARYKGVPCTGSWNNFVCHWETIDNNTESTRAIRNINGSLIQVHW